MQPNTTNNPRASTRRSVSQPKLEICVVASVVAISLLLLSGCRSSDPELQGESQEESGAQTTEPQNEPDNGLDELGNGLDGELDLVSAVPVGAYQVLYTAESGFVPRNLDVPTGELVAFVNDSDSYVWPASNIHPIHAILPSFDPQRALKPGEVWTYRFDENGRWLYHNHLEPTEGGIIVTTGGDVDSRGAELLQPDVLDKSFPDPPQGVTADYDMYNNDHIRNFLKLYGPAAAVRTLEEVAVAAGNECHSRAHVVGNLAFEEFGPSAFSLSSHECQSGAYHGALEGFFAFSGTDNLAGDASILCPDAETDTVMRDECLHGIGHGVLAWLLYELPDALEVCDELPTEDDHYSCYAGVFMENEDSGGAESRWGHERVYISNKDPHYPCNVLKEKYMSACYARQTVNMYRILNQDFAAVAQACLAAPEIAREACFRSYGRDVGQLTAGDPRTTIAYCEYTSEGTHRELCFQGAIGNRFNLTPGTDDYALSICAHIDHDPALQNTCYNPDNRAS